jgi:tetratricopeptide (TPR) repeat protein
MGRTYLLPLLLFTLGVSFVFTSCSSTKSTKATRAYHSFVSYFNGLYNANVLYKEGTLKADKTYKVPEEGFLGLITEGGIGGGQFDKVIEKCDVLIFRHKVGNYTDDAYLLKGKSEYFKGKYFEANIAFEYVLNEFPKTDLKTEATYWLAKTNYITNNRYRAVELLDETRKAKDVDDKLKVQIAALDATMLIDKKEYEKAIGVLEKNLPLVKKKHEKAKWHFLLAQLHEQIKDVDKAKRYYNSVIALNVSNDLNFRAKLNIVQLYIDNTAKNTSDYDEITAPIKKMLKDNKYKEFRDQLYFKLALMEHKRNDLPMAVNYYRAALASGGGRPVLKTKSYFQLGQIYFYKKSMLDSAQAYYDSAATSVDDKSPDAYAIRTMSRMLKRYKICKNTVKEQDSLLQIANLSPEEQKKKVAEYVEKEERWKEEAKRKREQEAAMGRSALMMQQFQEGQGQTALQTNANVFYFDNPTRVAQGKVLFVKLWGDRKLEDDWRRRNKSKSFGKMAFDEEEDKDQVSDDRNDPVNGVEARKKKYLARIPKTPEEKEKASEKILNALFELAQLFDQKFNMPDSAIKYYNLLVKKFPDSDYVPKSYYAIYNMYESKKNPRANEYKFLILEKYPNSQYARLLRKEKIEENNEASNDFNSAYKSLLGLYSAGDYETAINFSQVIIDNHLSHPELCKVYYIKGASYGSMENIDSMKAIYTFLRKSYPDEAVTKVALRTLQLLEQKQKGVDLVPKKGKEETLMTGETPNVADIPTDPAGQQLGVQGSNDINAAMQGFVTRSSGDPISVILMVEAKKLPKDKLEILVADFNKENFKSNNLERRVLNYTDNNKKNYQMVMISKFDNGQVANSYLEQILSNPEIMAVIPNPQMNAFFISATNFREAFSNKRFHHYAIYFLTNRDQLVKN